MILSDFEVADFLAASSAEIERRFAPLEARYRRPDLGPAASMDVTFCGFGRVGRWVEYGSSFNA